MGRKEPQPPPSKPLPSFKKEDKCVTERPGPNVRKPPPPPPPPPKK